MRVDDIVNAEMMDKKVSALRTAMQISSKAQSLMPMATSTGDEALIEDVAEISETAQRLCESFGC